MKKSFQLISYPLSCCGFDIYCQYSTGWQIFRRALFYISTIAVACCSTYSAFMDKQTVFSDRIFLINTALAYLSGILQGILFWSNKEKLLDITQQLYLLQTIRDEKWLEPLVKPIYDICSTKGFKITR